MDSSYSDISVEDLLQVIKGFVDMLILASGYQSSGLPAHWDSRNIKKAFQWAIFIEDVLRSWKSSTDHQDSVVDLDAALSEIISSPYFPQGLKHMSSTNLCQARNLILRRLIHTLPLRDAHLRATIAAIVEVDVQELQRISSDALRAYLDRLMIDGGSPQIQSGTSQISFEGGFTMCAVQDLGRRQLEVSRLSIAETGLDILSRVMRKSYLDEFGSTLQGEKLQLVTSFLAEEKPIDPQTWSLWRSRSLSYLLDKRTIRMVSGAKLLFSAPKHQWVEVIRRIDVPVETDDYYEKIELLLLGSIGSKWNSLIQNIVSSSSKCVTISKLYREVQDLLFRLQNSCSEENMSGEEKGALEYLEEVLSKQVHCLWKLFPVLPAMAIPLRSPLFRSYLIELESRMRGDSAIRCCSCIMDGKNHTECRNMKIPGVLRLKKIQILKWERRIGCSGSGVTVGSVVRKRIPFQVKCCQGSSYVVKQLFRRFKSQWEPALSWQRSTTSSSGYSYDAQSYSQNFDDGCCSDHRSPLAPSPR